MTEFKKTIGYKAVFILCVILLFSCHSNRKYIIPEKKFALFLADLHIAEAIGSGSYNTPNFAYIIDSASLYGSLFDKHRITPQMFDSTMSFYSRNPEKLQKLYNSVVVILKLKEEEIAAKIIEEENQREDVIWQDDTIRSYPPLKNDHREINVTISGPGIYTVYADVKILPNDESDNPKMSLYFYKYNGTPEGARIPFPEVKYNFRKGIKKTYKSQMQLDSAGYFNIKGYIFDYSNKDSLFERNTEISGLKITKKRWFEGQQ